MKILFDIGHPAHVHQFKNTINELKKHGHDVLITARNKEITLDLLDKIGLNYTIVGKYKKNRIRKILEMFVIDLKLYHVAKKFHPDILVGGVGNVYIAHVSFLLQKPSILFNDTEQGTLQNLLSFPLTNTIITPSCYKKNLGKKQIRYAGYQELAYLHPNWFMPNPSVLKDLGLTSEDPFILIRFVSWEASHDIGHHGIGDKIGLVKSLEKYGRVFISSEGPLPKELEIYKIQIPLEKIHDMQFYARLYLGESPTMTTESALLGTPAICISSWAGECGNFVDLSTHYECLYCYPNENQAFEKAKELLNTNHKMEWAKKREKILKEKIDVTAFMVWLIEKYPSSIDHTEKKMSDQNNHLHSISD